jgi:hypothetical protein
MPVWLFQKFAVLAVSKVPPFGCFKSTPFWLFQKYAALAVFKVRRSLLFKKYAVF